jgi:cyclopropane fatty-acyl-phospholipid synthase-like methyltransferase
MVYLIIVLICLSLALLWAIALLISTFLNAPWVPLPRKKVERMLKLADIKPNETVIDLGSGDARVLIQAAKDYQAKGIGIELNPFLVWLSRLDILARGLSDRIKIKRDNIYQADISQADVITSYLLLDAMPRLETKLRKEMKPGARVVCYAFGLKGWPPEVKERFGVGNIYLYRKN